MSKYFKNIIFGLLPVAHGQLTCTDVHMPNRARSQLTDRSTAVKIDRLSGRPTMSAVLSGFLDRPGGRPPESITFWSWARSTIQWSENPNGHIMTIGG